MLSRDSSYLIESSVVEEGDIAKEDDPTVVVVVGIPI